MRSGLCGDIEPNPRNLDLANWRPETFRGEIFPGGFVEARGLVLDRQNLGGFNGLFRHFVGESGPKSLRGLIT